jgi:hypothetical protein
MNSRPIKEPHSALGNRAMRDQLEELIQFEAPAGFSYRNAGVPPAQSDTPSASQEASRARPQPFLRGEFDDKQIKHGAILRAL